MRFNKNIVTKANNFVELPYKLTLLEQKIILFMVSLVQPEDSNFLLYRFSAHELIEFLDIKTNNYGAHGEIGKIIRSLKKKSVLIEKEGSILDMNWLASAEYYR
jgi:uncharacterized protein (DUF488 family)